MRSEGFRLDRRWLSRWSQKGTADFFGLDVRHGVVVGACRPQAWGRFDF